MPTIVPTLALALAATLLTTSCTPAADPSSPPSGETAPVTSEQPSLRPLFTAQHSGFEESTELVIRDRAAYGRAMQQARAGGPEEGTPEVDFEREMVILVATGTRSSGGYSVRVDSLARRGGAATVHYTETRPGAGCMTTQALTSPAAAVAAGRVEGEIGFERRVVEEDC